MDLMARIAAAKAAQAAKTNEQEPTHEEESRPQITTSPENRMPAGESGEQSIPSASGAETPAPCSEDGAGADAPEETPAPADSPAAVPHGGGLTLPKRPAALRPIGVKPLTAPAPAASAAPATAAPAAPAEPAKSSMLANLVARRDADRSPSPSPSPSPSGSAPTLPPRTIDRPEITEAAQSAVLAGPSYSPQEFLDEWNELEAQDPENVTEDDRAELLRKACARICELYDQEMEALRTGSANDMSMMELSQLVKLAFVRVKESPAAWAMIDRSDKAKVIKGIIAMAQKRNSAVKGRKPKDADALSSSFASAAAVEDAGAEELASLMGGFDLGSF